MLKLQAQPPSMPSLKSTCPAVIYYLNPVQKLLLSYTETNSLSVSNLDPITNLDFFQVCRFLRFHCAQFSILTFQGHQHIFQVNGLYSNDNTYLSLPELGAAMAAKRCHLDDGCCGIGPDHIALLSEKLQT